MGSFDYKRRSIREVLTVRNGDSRMPIRYVKKEFCYLYKTFSFLENSWVYGREAVNPTIKCACRLKTSHPGPTILGKWVNSVTFSGTENVS